MVELLEIVNNRLSDLIKQKEKCFDSAARRDTRLAYEINARFYVSLLKDTKYSTSIEELMEIFDGKKVKH